MKLIPATATLAITVCATKEHSQAMLAQAHRVQSNLIPWEGGVRIIIVGDDSAELAAVEQEYQTLLPAAAVERHAILTGYQRPADYKEAMMFLAQMRTHAFSRARISDPDFVWSLDSDVLPPANALRCMHDMLQFDGGYYGVATCPYPNQGFIGGRGDIHNPIFKGVYPSERQIPAKLTKAIAALKKDKPKDWEQKVKAIEEEIAENLESYPPEGNVFARNAKGWKRRGWLDDAYPALGKGAVVPVDWAGFGCNLINREALAHINFDGYAGEGTEDLFVCYHRWQQAGIRICAIPHVLCDHVKINPGRKEEKIIYQTHHEIAGEMVGHTRVVHRPYYQHQSADARNPKFTGRFLPVIQPLSGKAQTKKDVLAAAFAAGMLQVRSEADELCDWLEAQKLQDVLEIGTDRGGLLFLLLSQCTGRAVSVDKERGTYGTGVDFAWRNAAFDRAFPERIQWLSGDSQDQAIRKQVSGDFGLIVVDGDHTKAFADYSLYRDLLRPGGWMLFHDIKDTPEHRQQGVTVADDWKKVKKLAAETLEFSDPEEKWGGIGLARF